MSMTTNNDQAFWTDIRAGLLARVAAVERDPIRSRDPFWIDMRAADKGMAAAIERNMGMYEKLMLLSDDANRMETTYPLDT